MAHDRSQKLRIFLCHSSEDKPLVRILYHLLNTDSLKPWLDEKDLLPGEDWDFAIRNAVRVSDVVVVCLSKQSRDKAGFVQKEIRYALDVADEQPDGTIFIIPVRLEPCDVPERLRRWQWVNLYESNGFELLMRALATRADSLNIRVNLDGIMRQAPTLLNPDFLKEFAFDNKGLIVGEIFALIFDKKFRESQAKLERYMTENPRDYDLLYYYTYDLGERCDQKEQAISILNAFIPEAEASDPLRAGRLLKLRGLARLRLWYKGQNDESLFSSAEGDLLKSVSLNPKQTESYFHLALITALKGDLASVVTYLDEAINTCVDTQMKVWMNNIRNDLRTNPSRFLTTVKDLYR